MDRRGFSFCAICTSFIGTCLGVTSTLEPKNQRNAYGERFHAKGAKKVLFRDVNPAIDPSRYLPRIYSYRRQNLLDRTVHRFCTGCCPPVMCFIWFTSDERNSFHNVGTVWHEDLCQSARIFGLVCDYSLHIVVIV